MRQVLLFLHRWLGLTAGLIFGIAALTGGILVYQDELNDLLLGSRSDITPGLVDASTIESSVRRQYPDGHLANVDWPTPEVNVVRVTVRVPDSARPKFLDVDPGSGTVLEPRRLHILLAATRRLHTNLLLGRIGRSLLRYATIATVPSLLVGLYLWWPGLRGFARGFRIRIGRGLYALFFDLHQSAGVIALPLLLVMAGTGIMMDAAFQRALTALLHGRETVSSWTALQSRDPSPQLDTHDIELATAVRIAQAEAGSAPLIHVQFPDKPTGVVAVWMQGTSPWPHSAATRLALDRHTGTVLARQDLAYDASTNHTLHFGRIGGPVVRVLYTVASFVGFALLFTGAVMWWKRRNPNTTTKQSHTRA